MTQGIVSVRRNGDMLYKIVIGHDGMHAPDVAARIKSLGHVPSVEELRTICAEEDFGCPDCLIILEHNPEIWNKPKLHYKQAYSWDEESPDIQRYYDTFHVAQFNPRWKYGTAPYVEVVDLDEVNTQGV